MKHGGLLMCILFLQLFSSCMREDLTVCPDGNLLLSFSYEEGGQELFSEIASSVDILLFDTVYQLVHYERIEDPEVLSRQMITLALPAGDYFLVAWTNKGENCLYDSLTEESTFEQCSLIFSENTIGEPLYYGPKERAGGTIPMQIRVEEGQDKEETIYFTRSHRAFRFYIEGVVDEYNGESLTPLIEIQNVPAGYDFLMNLMTESRMQVKTRTEQISIQNRQMATQQIYLPLCPLTYSIEVKVLKNSDNSFLTSFNLAEYLRKNPPENEYEIDIYIGFFSGGIEITIPGWNSSEEITPGW